MRLLLILSFIFSLPVMAQVNSMDIETHTLLIEKLELGSSVNKDVSVELRIADLYSDRARLKSIEETEKNCKQCMSSNEDRKKAIKVYRSVFNKVDNTQRLRVFEQITQNLYALGLGVQADKFGQNIISGKYSKSLKAVALINRANQKFFKNKYREALKDYQMGLAKHPGFKSVLIDYRIAWCEFNTGRYMYAKSLLAKILISKKNIDATLRADIALDYAKFAAKGPVNKNEIVKIKNLSGAEAKSNIEFLASELDRLGRFNENLFVNHYLLEEFSTDHYEKAMAYIRIAQAEYSLGRSDQVVKTLETSISNIGSVNCRKNKGLCEKYKNKIDEFIVFWNRVEKDKPSISLLKFWKVYLKFYSSDYKMNFVAAQTFEKAKKKNEAVKFYLLASEILKDEIKNKENNEDQKKKIQLFEASLDAAIGVAERSKSRTLKENAYRGYLKLYPDGPKQLMAKYQLAYIKYEAKEYNSSVKEFLNVIGEYKKNPTKRNEGTALKSADLVLDILAIQKQNYQIMKYASDFSYDFKSKKEEYDSIYRKALINEIIFAFRKKSPREKEFNDLQERTRIVLGQKMSKSERVKILELRLQLSHKLQNVTEVNKTALALLKFSKLPESAKNLAYDELIWVNEAQLNFSKAFDYTRARYSEKNRSQKILLKLALLAELAKKDPNAYYRKALDKTRSSVERNVIRGKIVQNSKKPWRDLLDYSREMSRYPTLVSELALYTYGREPNNQKAKQILENPAVLTKPAGKQLARLLSFPNFNSLKAKLNRHRISSRSEKQSQVDVKSRLSLLRELEKWIAGSISQNNFTLQVAGLDLLQKEKLRFSRDLMNTPNPRGLNQVELGRYRALLAQNAAKIKLEGESIKASLDEIWKKASYEDKLDEALSTSTIPVKKLVILEAQFLLPSTPDFARGKMRRVAKYDLKSEFNSSKKIFSEIKNNPFSEKRIRELIEVEKQRNPTFVAFLEQRLEDIKHGGYL